MWENISSVKKNEYGFFQLDPIPKVEDLEKHYRERYYQEAESDTYSQEYDAEELEYIQGSLEEKEYLLKRFVRSDQRSFLDIGCGEGWALSYFHKHGWRVEGGDFSRYGIEKHNKEMVGFFEQGDIDFLCDRRIKEGKTYSVVHIDNVLEHVIDPKKLVQKCVQLLTEDGILYIDVPNDFNPLQKYLYEGGFIRKTKWVVEMEHISYFNKEGLVNLARACGLEPRIVLGTEVIEFFGLNPDTNYYDHPEVGHNCHAARRHWIKLLRSISLEKKIALSEALGDMGMGRNLIALFAKSST